MKEGSLFQNKYRIGKKLGEGGMGVVYAAVHERSGLRVAIKLVSAKEASARNLQTERLLRESRVLAQLSHNNLVRLHDCDVTPEGDFYIIMEHVEGDTLQVLIDQARKQGKLADPLHVRRMLHVMAQVAEGMAAAHKAGIVHRDLKPANMIVSSGTVARVVDFGLAKNQEPSTAPQGGIETDPAKLVGTPLYMAPEQIRSTQIDARADIYAMGLILYETLTGRTPYNHDGDMLSSMEIMGRHCFAPPTPMSSYAPGCPERVERIVLRCLAKDPADRYQSARDLAHDIRMLLAEEARAQQREQRAAANMPRETGPMPAQWTTGPALPFVAAGLQPSCAARETAPMPPPGAAGPPQPTYASTLPAPNRGVGYTTKMARPSAAALAEAEALKAQVQEQTSGTVPAVDETAIATRHETPSADPIVRSVGATSGVHLRPPIGASEAVPPAADPWSQAPSPSARRRVPPLFVAGGGGGVIAVLLVAVLLQTHPAERRGTAPDGARVVPAPASFTSAVPSAAAASSPSAAPSATAVVVPPSAAPTSEAAAPTTASTSSAIEVSVATASAAPSSAPTPKPTAAPVPRPKPTAIPTVASATAPGFLWPDDGASRPVKRPIRPPPRPDDDGASRPLKKPIRPPPGPIEAAR